MPDTFLLTVIFIALATTIAAVIKRVVRDKCLKDFAGDMITLEEMNGKIIWGNLRVESTGLELVFEETKLDEQGHMESSYILYKHEYPTIQALIRYHAKLSEQSRTQRDEELEKTYHPKFARRFKRRFLNFCKVVRDALAELTTVLLSRAKKTATLGSTLTTQDKYVSQIKNELTGAVGTSYDPLLERYIGHKVVLELMRGDKVIEYCGVLKDYTAEFVEVMDIAYCPPDTNVVRTADMVVLRKYGMIRHHAE